MPIVQLDSPALRISDLRKAYLSRDGRVVQAVTSFSVDVIRGERLAILGPSGCGKSTILRILSGLDAQFGGTIDWANDASADAKKQLRSATVFQGESTLPWMTISENLTAGLSGLKLDADTIKRRLDYHLRLVGLSEFASAYPHELSGGMRQRAAIARALATEPLLLLMDEPLAALDAQTRLIMQKELHWIWKQTQSTVVYITHDIEEAISLADRLLVMTARPGRIKAILDVPFGREVEPFERRRSAAFAELQAKVWSMVAEEVGQSLTSLETSKGASA